MRVIFVANAIDDLRPSMTTTRLIAAAATTDCESWVVALDGWGLDTSGAVIANARLVPRLRTSTSDAAELTMRSLQQAPVQTLKVDAGDRCLVRLNPARFGRAEQVAFVLWIFRHLQARGVRVINSIAAVERVASKAFLSCLPASLRPAQVVASNIHSAMEAIAELGPSVVLKPARGSRGRGVVALNVSACEPRPVLEMLLEYGPVVVQEHLAGAEQGDCRILLIDGQSVQVGGHLVAVRRTPPPGQLRSNLHAGGQAALAQLTTEEERLIERLRPHLAIDGLRMVGLDVIGGKVIEVNAWAPGGLGPFESLSGP